MQDIIKNIWNTLRTVSSASFKAFFTMERTQWIRQDPAQISLLINNIIWVNAIEECFTKMSSGDANTMKDYLETLIANLTDLIKLVQGKLDKPLRQKLMCLITLDANMRDKVL